MLSLSPLDLEERILASGMLALWLMYWLVRKA